MQIAAEATDHIQATWLQPAPVLVSPDGFEPSPLIKSQMLYT